jgi:hypothetical protein
LNASWQQRFQETPTNFQNPNKNPFYGRIFKKKQRIATKKAGLLFTELASLQGLFDLLGFNF